MLVRLSHCCNPIPGDEIVGYITKGRGVSVHRVDCPNVKRAAEEGTRLIDVSWNIVKDTKTFYDAEIQVEGYNRPGLLNDVLQAINNATKYLNFVNGKIGQSKVAIIDAKIGVKNHTQLERVIDSIKRVPDVYVVRRTIN